MNDGNSLHVLIVGIDKWINTKLPPLDGCVNDTKLMQSVFQDRFGVPDENLVILANETATRQAITDAFRTHLIDRARQNASNTNSDAAPSFVFCYAGHGSRAKDKSGTQPDGLDETIVPYDSRTGDVYDIKDFELGSWLDELTSYSKNVTVILDCCHSGSGTRDTESTGTPRICPPDMRDQPTERPAAAIAAGTRSSGGPTTMAAQDNYTLLAACRNYEYAQEYVLTDGEQERKHGAFTYFLAEELLKIPPGRTPTYREVFERVRYSVSKKYRSQMPQCEGDRERLLFGGVTAVRDPLMTVERIKRKDNSIWVDAGLVHGLTTGTVLNVYPPETRTVDESTQVLGTITIVRADAVRSRCKADDNLAVEQFSRVAVHASSSAMPKRVVAIDVSGNDDLVRRISDHLQNSELKPYVDVITSRHESVDFSIGLSTDQELTIRDSSGRLVVQPTPMNAPHLVAKDVAALCRYHNVLDLRNQSRTSALHGKISVEFHTVIEGQSEVRNQEKTRAVHDVKPISRTADGVPVVEMGTPIAIEVKNNSDKPLFCEAISFGYDFAIVPLTELVIGAGVHKRVDAGSSAWFGRDITDNPIKFFPPDDDDERKQFTEAREFLKIVATEHEADYTILKQDGLRVPPATYRSASGNGLDQIFAQAMSGTRALGARKEAADESDWTTTEIEYLVTRPSDTSTHEVAAGSRVALPDYNLEVETPQGLNCRVRVLSKVENVRSVDNCYQEQPSGPVWESGVLEAISLTSHRSTAPVGAVIEIEADTDELSKVSAEEPLSLHLPNAQDASTVAIAWDGEFAFPVGASRETGRVDIDWLPNSDASSSNAEGENVAAGSRSLMRCVKLYLYRSADRKAAELGIHKVEFTSAGDPDDNSVSQRLVNKEEIKAGQRVALIIGGFPSDSVSLASQIHPVLTTCDPGYDHILTFDYESYGTPVGKNATTLFQALKGAGFFMADEVHLDVIAHGTGAIIARAMIELENGHRLVDRCYCVGAPHLGSPLLKLKEAASFLGAFMMNSCYRGSFAAAFLSFMLRKVARDGRGFSDLSTNSPFLDRLAKNGKRDKVEYHCLAGNFHLSAEERNYYQRLWDRVRTSGHSALSKLFGDEHDMVARTPAMLHLSDNPEEKPPASAVVVDCHHFDYFSNPQALAELAQRL